MNKTAQPPTQNSFKLHGISFSGASLPDPRFWTAHKLSLRSLMPSQLARLLACSLPRRTPHRLSEGSLLLSPATLGGANLKYFHFIQENLFFWVTCRIESVTSDPKEGHQVRVSWFYRPEEAAGGRKARICPQEGPVAT